jgi:hypothetical protein
MALKKSDKIIAIAGVLILIIAAISIVVLYSPEKVEEKTISEEKTFYVTWEENTGVTSISGSVSKKAPYADPITVTVQPTDLVGVLTNVKIQLVWTDKVTYRGIFSKGKDTLTAYIYPTGDQPGQPDVTVGKGNSSFDFGINSVPTSGSVTAIDIDAANGKIKGEFSGKDTASFDTKITIKYGEKLRRPLKYLKEKGDDFDLTITYTYYSPVVTEVPGDQVPPQEPATPYLGMLVNTGSSIRW